jgi:hypothetical protein
MPRSSPGPAEGRRRRRRPRAIRGEGRRSVSQHDRRPLCATGHQMKATNSERGEGPTCLAVAAKAKTQ